MSQWLRQGTARVIPFGPFLDKGNGVDLETGLVSALDHATTGIMLSKNGGTLTIREQGANFIASTYDAHGCYKVSLSAIDTGAPGQLRATYTDPATNLPDWQDFMVVPAQVWDSLFGTDKLDVAVVEQANLDFGALQKLSLNAATPASVQNLTQGATAEELAAAQVAIEEVMPDISGLALEAGLEAHVTAALAAYDPPDRAEATTDKEEILAALTSAGITVEDILAGDLADDKTFPADSLGDQIRKMFWLLCNRLIIANATGAFTAYKNNGVTPGLTGTLVDDGQTTRRNPA